MVIFIRSYETLSCIFANKPLWELSRWLLRLLSDHFVALLSIILRRFRSHAAKDYTVVCRYHLDDNLSPPKRARWLQKSARPTYMHEGRTRGRILSASLG